MPGIYSRFFGARGKQCAEIVAVYGDPTFNRLTTSLRVSHKYDHTQSPLQNHMAAVQALVNKLEARSPGAWAGKWHAGGVGDGYLWVRENDTPHLLTAEV
jgi:hypothetical protein